MAEPVLMPQVGQDIKTAKIVDWLKKESDEVKKGEVIAVVESDKAAFDVEAYASGVLVKILHPEGDEVEVLTPIAYIGQPGEKIEDGGRQTEDGGQKTQDAVAANPPSAIRHPQSAGRLAVSPSARRIAGEKGIGLDAITGTGPGGRIIKRDVLAAGDVVCDARVEGVPPSDRGLEAPYVAPPPSAVFDSQPGAAGPHPAGPDTVVMFSPMRARIAERLIRSKQTIPHFYISMDADMSEAMRWRRQFNEAHGTKVTVTDMIVKAVALALSDYPKMNAHVEQDRMILKAAINIGVAVSVEDGLIVPVIADAAGKSIIQISSATRENAEAARAGRLKPQAVGGFTVTNLGMYGVDTFVPVINPPEAAILAVGAVVRRPVVADDGIVAREMMTMTLACDHRAGDGTYAAQFLGTVKRHLKNPASL